MVSKEAPAAPSATSWEITRRTSTIATHPVARTSRNETLFAGSQRLHILATVEILQRLLATELQPIQHQLLQSCWISPNPLALIALPLPTPTGIARPPSSPARPFPDAQRAFAIAHHLLAPPVA